MGRFFFFINVNQHLPLLAANTVWVCVCRCRYTQVEGSSCSLDVRTTNSVTVIKKKTEGAEEESGSGVRVVKDQRDNLDGGGKQKLNEHDLCGRSC